MLYGLVVAVPIDVPLAKNATEATEPSVSLAFAVTVTAGGDVIAAPAAGAVMLADGATFGAAPVAGSKNRPLTLALPGPLFVTRIVTWPEMLQTRYCPPEKLDTVRVSSTAPVVAFTTSTCSMRPSESQSST